MKKKRKKRMSDFACCWRIAEHELLLHQPADFFSLDGGSRQPISSSRPAAASRHATIGRSYPKPRFCRGGTPATCRLGGHHVHLPAGTSQECRLDKIVA